MSCANLTDEQLRESLVRVVTDQGGDLAASSLSQSLSDVPGKRRDAIVDQLVSEGVLRCEPDSRRAPGGKPQLRIKLAVTHRTLLRNWQPAHRSFTELRAVAR